MARRRVGQCVYCGETRALTEDHVPPKALWRRPRPADLIVIPSCGACNRAASLDDEYFKTVMVLKEGAGSHPEAVLIRDSVFRGFRMPEKLGFARFVVGSTRRVRVRTQGGLYLGRRPALDVDLVRLRRIVARITRGLFWHHTGRRLPAAVDVIVYSEDDLMGLQQSDLDAIRTGIVGAVLNNPVRSIGRGVLKYWHAFAADDADASAWIYEFYADVRFAVLIMGASGSNQRLHPTAAGTAAPRPRVSRCRWADRNTRKQIPN